MLLSRFPLKVSLTLAAAVFALAGCHTAGQGEGADKGETPVMVQVTRQAIKASGTALAKLDEVPGTYEGVIPCADCEGIKTTYHLHADGTFTTVSRYLGTKEVFKSFGNWRYRKGILFLTDNKDPQPYLIRAEKDQLRLLDEEGKAVTDETAEKYILQKLR